MNTNEVTITLSNAEALVLFEWLASADDAGLLPINHAAEQIALWRLEGQLEKKIDCLFSQD
ncbi:hypothetical protein QFZ27_005238 [Inquilinus ginsengisoli]|uniref:hypothetical protein n=1 Tax=Inquilinus ginsengisoli TaxID=363840 RepID=UPI003D1D171B